MVKVKSFLIVTLVLLCALSVVAGDFMPPPQPRGGAKAKAKKAPSVSLGAYTEGQLLGALEMGGDQLLRWQHLDGGWIWPGVPGDEFKTTDTATSANQKGVVALALVLIDDSIPAKDYIGDGSYPGARYTGEKFRERNPSDGMYAPDYTFMCELTEATAVQDYKTSATQVWNWKKANSPPYSTPFNFSDYFMTNRCAPNWVWSGGYGYGLCIWDIAGYAGAAEKMGDHVFAFSILDNWCTEQDWTNPPAQVYAQWNDTANGYNKCVMNNFLKRWDDNDATSTTLEREWFFIGAAGNMLWAMNEVDPVYFDSWIQAMKTRLINDCQTAGGAYVYSKLGEPIDVCVQDQGYAMMGMRNIGAVDSGRKSTEWAINNQETTGDYKGMWIEPWGLSYQEGNSECLQGMFDVHEGDVNPWVVITVHPLGNHIDTVPVSFKVYDVQGDPATLWVEWSDNAGSDWQDCTTILGATTGLMTSPSGIEHSITWKSIDDIPIGTLEGLTHDCKLRIWARDDSKPGQWGSPAGVTNIFSVLNETIPVELSIFSVE